MIPEGQSFPIPPLPFQMKNNYQCKKMKWTIAQQTKIKKDDT